MRINNITFKLHPYRKLTLKPRSKTIVQAIATQNKVGIVQSEETISGVFIGNCLVDPKDYVCPISRVILGETAIEERWPVVIFPSLSKRMQFVLLLTKAAILRVTRRENFG